MKKQILLPLCAAMLVSACCSKPTASAAPAETKKAKVIEVIHVLRQSTMPSFSKLGVVEANQETKLAFGALGKILTLSAVKGMKVNKGDVLASLDTTVPQSSIALSQAQIKEVQAKRDKIVRGNDNNVKDLEDSISKQKVRIESEKQNTAKDKADLDRALALLNSGAIAASEADNLQAKVKQDQLNIQSEEVTLAALHEPEAAGGA